MDGSTARSRLESDGDAARSSDSAARGAEDFAEGESGVMRFEPAVGVVCRSVASAAGARMSAGLEEADMSIALVDMAGDGEATAGRHTAARQASTLILRTAGSCGPGRDAFGEGGIEDKALATAAAAEVEQSVRKREGGQRLAADRDAVKKGAENGDGGETVRASGMPL